MVVHLENATATGRAVVCAVWLARLALFAEPNFAIRLRSERGRGGVGVVRWQSAVSIVVCCATWRREHGDGI